MEEDQFEPNTMLPKVEAGVSFLETRNGPPSSHHPPSTGRWTDIWARREQLSVSKSGTISSGSREDGFAAGNVPAAGHTAGKE